MEPKRLYTLKQNGMTLVESLYDNDVLLVICPNTDELGVLKKVDKKTSGFLPFGLKYKGNVYTIEHNFTLSDLVTTLDEVSE